VARSLNIDNPLQTHNFSLSTQHHNFCFNAMQKTQKNAELAAAKAKDQRVYISGLKGQHSLETGVAYHYRGHYIYACPVGNPVEPVPFSTSRGVQLAGTARELAPEYDPAAPGLVLESTISALKKSCQSLSNAQQGQEKQVTDSSASASSLGIHAPRPQDHRPTTNFAPTMPAPTRNMFVHEYIRTPHDRARFLGESAPSSHMASHTNTPIVSRPVSPTQRLDVLDTRIRQVASTARLSLLSGSESISQGMI
jgi:hypothetical protein